MQSFLKKSLLISSLAVMTGCGMEPRKEELIYAVSIEPAGMILAELVGGRGECRVLLAAGASPHHYEPSPSDARFVERAVATFYFDPTVDAWAARLAGDRAVQIFDSDSNGEEHHHENPHVWLDPIAVRDRLPKLVESLIKLDPEGEDEYRNNAQRFAETLTELDRQAATLLSGAKGRAVVQAHPSWDLFLERYGIDVAGVLETAPGVSLPPRQFAELSETVSKGEVFAIIAEPQLPREPLETLADGNAPIVELDPLGGRGDLTTYAALIRINAQRLAGAIP